MTKTTTTTNAMNNHAKLATTSSSTTTCHAAHAVVEQENSKCSYSSSPDAGQEWDADRYRNQHSFVYEFGTSLMDILDPKPGERILDVGCGTGELTAKIAERVGVSTTTAGSSRGGAVIGLDADFNMIAAARLSFPNVTFLHADASSFTMDGEVDAIFSNAALHWVTRAEDAVISMSRALKPGGRFVVEFGGKGNVQRMVQAARAVALLGTTASNTPDVWYFPSIGEYCSLLEKHGIEVTSAILYDRPTILQGPDGMKNWFRMFGSALFQEKAENEDDMETILQQIEDMLKPDLFDGEQWTADYRRIRIVGRKNKGKTIDD